MEKTGSTETERDDRWANVYAYIRPLWEVDFPIDDPNLEASRDWWRVRIEVSYNSWFFWQNQELHKDDLETIRTTPGGLAWLMEEMVKMMDERISNGGELL